MVRAIMKDDAAIARMQACGTYFTIQLKPGASFAEKDVADRLGQRSLTLDQFDQKKRSLVATAYSFPAAGSI